MFSRLTRRFPGLRSRRRPAGRQMQIEDLEGRSLLTAIPLNFGATVISAPVVINGEMFFAADDATHGVQLWESPTARPRAPTRLTDGNDVNGGIYPNRPDRRRQHPLLLRQRRPGRVRRLGNGDQLWKSNGTAAGTTMVTDSNDGVANASLYPVRS